MTVELIVPAFIIGVFAVILVCALNAIAASFPVVAVAVLIFAAVMIVLCFALIAASKRDE